MPFAFNNDLSFDFDTLYFSQKHITLFCNFYLKMDNPTLASYANDRGHKQMVIVDKFKQFVKTTVIFDQQPKNTKHTVTLDLYNTKDGIHITETIDINTFAKYLSYIKSGTTTVYLYVVTKSYTVLRYPARFGVHGVEGVVNYYNYFEEDWPRAKDTEWLKIQRILRDSIAHVWYYDIRTKDAVDLLNQSCRKGRNKYLKKQYKNGKIIRVKHDYFRKSSNQLKRLFTRFGGSELIAGKICTALRRYGIYTIAQFRNHKISPEEFSKMRSIGPKTVKAYETALDVILQQDRFYTLFNERAWCNGSTQK